MLSERNEDKRYFYNLSSVEPERLWLQNLLLESSDTETEQDISDEDEYIKDMLRMHLREQKYREKYHTSRSNSQYGYYGVGFLSFHDMFPEHRRSIVGVRKRKIKRGKKIEKLMKLKQGKKQTVSSLFISCFGK